MIVRNNEGLAINKSKIKQKEENYGY